MLAHLIISVIGALIIFFLGYGIGLSFIKRKKLKRTKEEWVRRCILGAIGSAVVIFVLQIMLETQIDNIIGF